MAVQPPLLCLQLPLAPLHQSRMRGQLETLPLLLVLSPPRFPGNGPGTSLLCLRCSHRQRRPSIALLPLRLLQRCVARPPSPLALQLLVAVTLAREARAAAWAAVEGASPSRFSPSQSQRPRPVGASPACAVAGLGGPRLLQPRLLLPPLLLRVPR